MAEQTFRVAANGGSAADELMISLLAAADAVERRCEEALARVELSMAKFDALSLLAGEGEPVTLGACATSLECARSNVTQLIDRLEAEGLVVRVEIPGDRRAVCARITELGRARQAAGEKLLAQVRADFRRAVAGTDLQTLETALEALL